MSPVAPFHVVAPTTIDTPNGVLREEDYGMGGMALADLNGDGLDEVIFAPVYSLIPHTGGTVRSHLHVLAGSSGQLHDPLLGAGIQVGETSNDDFLGYGACGIAVADLPTTPVISKAIFVAILNGELVVFQQSNGVVNQNPLFRTVVAGGIGAFNSIVVADLEHDPASKPEVYIAGSSGLRRFDFP